ncbi:uncharacterized protein [Ptychodera flava]|uniref:uncharacterized protein n=1 Tax=Ptychodera flava TaxID=63121 RepID=UPI00396A73FB
MTNLAKSGMTRQHQSKRKPVFDCRYCGKRYSVRSRFEIHLSGHTETETFFSCYKCKKSFETRALLLDHERSHTSDKKFTCKKCGKKFPNVKGLLGHELIHRDNNPHVCKYCGRRFAAKSTRIVHERTHTGEKPYKCRYCNKAFAQRNGVDLHEKTWHNPQNKRREREDKKREKKGNTIRRRIQQACPKCGKKCTNKGNLVRHMSVHVKKSPPPCKYCSKTFRSFYHLKVHELSHLKRKKFTCIYCGKKCSSKIGLLSHERVHQAQESYRCLRCDKEFCDKLSLLLHEQRGHRKDRQISCKQCGKKYPDMLTLKVHSQVHAKDKLNRWSCKQCGKIFKGKYAFMYHEVMHGNCTSMVPAPPALPLIGDAVRNKETPDLKSAEKVKEGKESEKPQLQCDYCSFKCRSVRVMGSHEATEHKYIIKTIIDSRKHHENISKKSSDQEKDQACDKTSSDSPQEAEKSAATDENSSQIQQDGTQSPQRDFGNIWTNMLSSPADAVQSVATLSQESLVQIFEQLPETRVKSGTERSDSVFHAKSTPLFSGSIKTEITESAPSQDSFRQVKEVQSDDVLPTESNSLTSDGIKKENVDTTSNQDSSRQEEGVFIPEIPTEPIPSGEESQINSGLPMGGDTVLANSGAEKRKRSSSHDSEDSGKESRDKSGSFFDSTSEHDDSNDEDYHPEFDLGPHAKRSTVRRLNSHIPHVAPTTDACEKTDGRQDFESAGDTTPRMSPPQSSLIPLSRETSRQSSLQEQSTAGATNSHDSAPSRDTSETETADEVNSETSYGRYRDTDCNAVTEVKQERQEEEQIQVKVEQTSGSDHDTGHHERDNPYIIQVDEIKSEEGGAGQSKQSHQTKNCRVTLIDLVEEEGYMDSDKHRSETGKSYGGDYEEKDVTAKKIQLVPGKTLPLENTSVGSLPTRKNINDERFISPKQSERSERVFTKSRSVTERDNTPKSTGNVPFKANNTPVIVIDDAPEGQSDVGSASSSEGSSQMRFFKRCVHCDIGYADLMLFLLHRGFHGPDGAFHCSACGRMCRDSVEFNIHLSSHPLS